MPVFHWKLLPVLAAFVLTGLVPMVHAQQQQTAAEAREQIIISSEIQA